MPWHEETRMSLREEFVRLAKQEVIPFAALCQRFGVSRTTGYKWLHRANGEAHEDFADRSRRPHSSPTQTAPEIAEAVVALRLKHPAWGGRKIARVLANEGYGAIPAPSTITHILRRQGVLFPRKTGEGAVYRRFEHARPNQLWQMDFKGYFSIRQGRCEPLTILDDHSRYNLALTALRTTHTRPVQQVLADTFRRYGLPERINTDNGQPWGSPSAQRHGLSQLSIWLIRLGIRISFSRPAHPQTNGKDERFHRTLKAEVLDQQAFSDLQQVQQVFDEWRHIYNHRRPHEALALDVPASRYQPSPRSFPEQLPTIEYSPDDYVTVVKANGMVRFKRCPVKVSKALRGLPIAFRARYPQEDVFDLYFCHHRIGSINLKEMHSSIKL